MLYYAFILPYIPNLYDNRTLFRFAAVQQGVEHPVRFSTGWNTSTAVLFTFTLHYDVTWSGNIYEYITNS